MRLAVAAALLLLAAAPACKVKEGKAPQKIPAGIDVPVSVDGGATQRLTTEWLSANEAAFRDAEYRAWRLSALAGPVADQPGARIEADASDGATATLVAGTKAVPVLTFNRQGELVVKLLDPANPFPPYHGRGGNRGRGEEEERIRGVTAIRVSAAAGP